MKGYSKIALCIAVGLSTLTSSYSQDTFKDLSKHWSKSYVEFLAKKNLVKGDNGLFNPEAALKTEDFIIMAVKTVDSTAVSLKAAPGETYYKPYMDRAITLGLIQGEYDEIPQYIERSMPRELAVQVISRALTLQGDKTAADQDLQVYIKDFKIVNDINRDALLKCFKLGITKGTNGKFEPKNPLTRAEAAVLVAKLIEPNYRDKVTFSINKKSYGEVADWFIKAFEDTVTPTPVMIVNKGNGVYNSGDVDYTERPFVYNKQYVNWWTDQAFEDLVLNSITQYQGKRFNALSGYFDEFTGTQLKGIKYSSGDFTVHDGQLMFTRYDRRFKDKAFKMTELPFENNNRLMYDIAKYNTQFALAQGLYSTIECNDDGIRFTIGQSDKPEYSSDITTVFHSEPHVSRRHANFKFDPMFTISLAEYSYGLNKPYLKQLFCRIYGEKTGVKLFNELGKWISPEKVHGQYYVVIDGVKAYFDGGDGYFQVSYSKPSK